MRFLLFTGILLSGALQSFSQHYRFYESDEVNIDLDSVSVSDSVEVFIDLKISKFKEGDQIELYYGRSEGSGDLFTRVIQYTEISGQPYVRYNSELLAVTNGRVTLNGSIHRSLARVKPYLQLVKRDKANKVLQQINKSF